MKLPHTSRALLAILTAFGLQAPALALNEPEFMAAFQQFNQALQGKSDMVDAAAERFSALAKAEPGHPVLLAYAGSATSLRATTTMLPWKKMSYAEDGLAQIDKALAMLGKQHDQQELRGTPWSLETRFVAATTFLGLPGMFNRGPRGAKLLQEVITDPLFSASPEGFQGAVLMRAAKQADTDKQADKARQLYTDIVQRKLPQADAAANRLKALQP